MSSSISMSLGRSLRLVRRRDVVVQPVLQAGQPRWSIKDPLALRYYQLDEQEFWLFEQLDGRTTLEQLRRAFERRFVPRRLSREMLQGFLQQLHDEGLLLAQSAGQGEVLYQRQQRRQRLEFWQRLASPWAQRFRGVDLDRWLSAARPLINVVWSAWSAALAIFTVLAALLLVTVQWEGLLRRMPTAADFFSPLHVIMFLVSIALVKVAHELGHATACKRYGGECHEIGLLLLFLTPSLYCDVSDAWMIRNKRHRLIVSAAGMIVELVIAAVATFVWWCTLPGLIHNLALTLMFVCSVNTLLLNGNPLLRYDGYYLLADALEMPNLAQQASQAWRRVLTRCLWGIEPAAHAQPRSESGELLTGADLWQARLGESALVGYSMASWCYGTLVLAVAVWALSIWSRPYGLQPLVYGFAAMIVVGAIAPSVNDASRWLQQPRGADELRWRRAVLIGSLVLLLLGVTLFAPWPRRLQVPVVLQPAEAQAVYVTAPGEITAPLVRDGQTVKKGDPLVKLTNRDVEREVIQLRAKRDQQQTLVASLERRQVQDPRAADDLPSAREALTDLQSRLQQRERDEARLTLRASRSGVVLPPPLVPRPEEEAEALPVWWGDPRESVNAGAWLTTGTLFCLIGEPGKFEAVAVIDQAEIAAVRVGQRVELRLSQLVDRTLSGEVVEIAERELTELPTGFMQSSEIPLRNEGRSSARPVSSTYQARLRLDTPELNATIGATGLARIELGSESLFAKFLRWWNTTVRFELR